MTQIDIDLLEPVLDINDIQGNIIPGFNKDHRTILGFIINDCEKSKAWIKTISVKIATLKEVNNFKINFKREKQLLGMEPSELKATWINISFSYDGLKKLVKDLEKAEPFFDNAFKKGLPLSSVNLGDPTDTTAEGNVSNWVIGKQGNIPDILLIIDSDEPQDMKTESLNTIEMANKNGLEKIYEEAGHNLAYYGNEQLRGHEHFGFKDGISQPGIRGRLSNNPRDYLTPRPDAIITSSNDSDSPEFSMDGKPLIAPGEFVIGYPVQNFNHPRKANPADQYPDLLRNGSYLVFRRLRQDVVGFNDFADRESQRLSSLEDFSNINSIKLKSMIVGRWPSGTPVSKSPDHDNPELSKGDSNNTFGYGDDINGYKTPLFSHIRKVNPRDLSTDDGGCIKNTKKKHSSTRDIIWPTIRSRKIRIR